MAYESLDEKAEKEEINYQARAIYLVTAGERAGQYARLENSAPGTFNVFFDPDQESLEHDDTDSEHMEPMQELDELDKLGLEFVKLAE